MFVVRNMAEWSYNYACTCDGYCEICSVKFTLDCSGPDPNSGEIDFTVTSRDLTCQNREVTPAHFSDELEESSSQNKGVMLIRHDNMNLMLKKMQE
jgi:hypothetical protein